VKEAWTTKQPGTAIIEDGRSDFGRQTDRIEAKLDAIIRALQASGMTVEVENTDDRGARF
jgi:hypothetical protein